MAAGIIQTTVTTTTGETIEQSFWVDDTVTPTKYIPMSMVAASATAAFDLGSGTGGSGTQRVILDSSQLGSDPTKAEDAASASADVGIPAMFIQQAAASLADTAGTAGDYEMGRIKDGRIWVQTGSVSASASFTPANTSHTGGSAGVIGDCVGAAAEFAFNAPSGSRIRITDAEFEIDNATAVASAFRVYLYNVTPPSALADDAALTFDSGDRASFLGYIDLGTAVDHGNTSWNEVHGCNKTVKLSGTSAFGYLVNLTTATLPANAHVVKLYADIL